MTAEQIIEQTKWPESSDEATADRLIVHGARIAMAIDAESHEFYTAVPWDHSGTEPYRAAVRRYMDSLVSMIAQAQVTIALREIQKRSPEQAAELAVLLWELTEDGGALSEIMWDVLNERGIDAQAVWDHATETAAKRAHVEAGEQGSREMVRCDYCGEDLPSVRHRSHVPTTPNLQRMGFAADKVVCPECVDRRRAEQGEVEIR